MFSKLIFFFLAWLLINTFHNDEKSVCYLVVRNFSYQL